MTATAATPFPLCACLVLLLLCLASRSSLTTAFVLPNHGRATIMTISSSTLLASTPPPRQPRRNLKKRRTRRSSDDGGNYYSDRNNGGSSEFPWDTAESRPIVSSKSREAGEDYWIDDAELERSLQRKEAIKNRKAMEGEISKEKLWSEVLSPYKQNWIGIFSMIIVILIMIGAQFPELLNQPVIPIPDL